VHFYHVAGLDGEWWQASIDDHFKWLAGRFKGRMYVTVVGTEEQRVTAQHHVTRKLPAGIDVTWSQAEAGFEDLTLNRLRDYASTVSAGTKILYAHTKGSYHPGSHQVLWRNGMDRQLLSHWPALLRRMDRGSYDAAGAWWIAPRHFSGNFWVARAGYIRTLEPLPELDADSRYSAEIWIGSGKAFKPLALSTGWPKVWTPRGPRFPLQVKHLSPVIEAAEEQAQQHARLKIVQSLQPQSIPA
jgi:hypothetical protein